VETVSQVLKLMYLLTLVDHRADFYALGAILHQLLTGKLLFGEYIGGVALSAEDGLRIAALHRSQAPPPPTSNEQPLVDQLILKLLHKNPDGRYQAGIQRFNQA
jgi:serine/threonine protein kinase